MQGFPGLTVVLQELLVVFRRTAPRNWLSEVKAAVLGDALPPAKPQLRRCALWGKLLHSAMPHT